MVKVNERMWQIPKRDVMSFCGVVEVSCFVVSEVSQTMPNNCVTFKLRLICLFVSSSSSCGFGHVSHVGANDRQWSHPG